MKILSVIDIQKLLQNIGVDAFLERLISTLEEDFKRWHEFDKSSRHAIHSNQGVIELMPCADRHIYTCKYVTGHPVNTAQGKLSVVAIGILSEISTGYPLMISEMTLLTALRTAATGALAAKYLARQNSETLAIIGTGAQAEFQVLGLNRLFPIKTVCCFDVDKHAMAKFTKNMVKQDFVIVSCQSIPEAIRNADIIITGTAKKQQQVLFQQSEIAPGTHIQAMGGDCPGKTELDPELLKKSKVVVEFLPQSIQEGEIQLCDSNCVHAELWELICHDKKGRGNNHETTVFDAVGFALEDYSVLHMVYQLADQYQLGSTLPLIPKLDDPKDLFSLVAS